MAAPAPKMSAAQPMGMSAAPVNPHDTLTAPIGPPAPEPVPMMAAGKPGKESAPKMSANDQIEQHEQGQLMGDYQKDNDPYGSPDNHPGFLGKLAHAGNMFLRNAIHETGKLTNREQEEKNLQSGIQSLEKDKSEEGLQGATAEHTRAETPEVAPNAAAQRGLQESETGLHDVETDQKRQDIAQGPTLARTLDYYVNKALQENRDPGDDPLVQHVQDAITSLQKAQQPKSLMQSQPVIGPDGKPHTYLLDPVTGKQMGDEGVHYEKPNVTNINEGHKEKGEVLKLYQPALDSGERFNVMTQSYEKAIKDHDQQAMLNLLANHLGMTMGLQKGARLTKDIINEAKQSQPWLAGIQSKFDSDGYLSGVTLSPKQMRQMVDLGRSRFAEDTTKARNEASYVGAQDDGPARTPTAATINHYLGLSNGDPAKAKQLAAQDGWTIK